MRKWSSLLWVASAALFLAAPASAFLDIQTEITCSDSVPFGDPVTADVRIENRECTALSGRIVTSYIGNAGGTVNQIGFFGPVLAATVAIPAATDLLPGTCDLDTFTCDGSGGTIPCIFDPDCECRVVTPGSLVTSVGASPATPLALQGSVATYVALTEIEGFEETRANECLIALPEPGPMLHLTPGLITLLALARRRAGSEENAR